MMKATLSLALVVLACAASLAAAAEEEKMLIPWDAGKCLESVEGVDGCLMDIIESSFTGQIHLSRDCCQALEGIGDHCFSKIFSFFPDSSAPLVKAFCASQLAGAPALALLPTKGM
ncbi:hypothetical protein QJS04_geneDACA008789 [Acorus gramineus]|uniref:Prolamin-like domain-containing protein n=1 Tax=Acorus gramineus TaxID=55184 RepID=A0AAV9AFN4_ACOGR|nr:hypothetical protein QJS04_geneDACA008789 [Acorus gramineus]